ncbi:MAG: ATP-binding protein [Candidatus Bathyarchaeia archaeon]|nr:ATP-binding protein [Candidatus Bathyarchaeota archaeon]
MEKVNPWWRGREGIEEDEDYIRWKESKIRWDPPLLEKIELKPFSLSFLFGPRQIGKTTLVKLLIKKLLQEADPKSIFYYRCDKLTDFKELDEKIGEYLRIKKVEGIGASYIFLDEVTFPKEWFRAVKYRIDVGDLKRDALFLAGSLSMFAKGEVETFPGRRGFGGDFVLHPVSFREFIKISNPPLHEKLVKIQGFSPKEIRERCGKLLPWLPELNEALASYLSCGGFPLSIKSLLEKGKVSQEAKDSYLSAFLYDLMKLKRNEAIAKRVLKAIIEKAPSSISLNSVAKEFEIRSHKTVFYYLDLFEKLFIAKNVYFIEPNKNIEVFSKERKVHLTDPFLYHVFSDWCSTRIPEEPVIIESVVASHLARKLRIGYWKNNFEIDIVLPEKLVGFEVKWRRKAEPKMRRVGKYRDIIYLTREEFNDDPVAVPASAFLGCLEV